MPGALRAAAQLCEYLYEVGTNNRLTIFSSSSLHLVFALSPHLPSTALGPSQMSDTGEDGSDSNEQLRLQEQKCAHQRAEKAQQVQDLIIKDQGKRSSGPCSHLGHLTHNFYDAYSTARSED